MEKAIEMLVNQGVMIEQLSEDLHCKGDRGSDINRSNEYHALAVILSNHAAQLSEISAIVEGFHGLEAHKAYKAAEVESPRN